MRIDQPDAGARPSRNGLKDASHARATPVARRVAKEEGVSLDEVQGAIAGDQVTKDDVLAFVAQRKEEAACPSLSPPSLPPVDDERAGMLPLAVKRLAAEHNIDLRELAAGRPLSSLTRYDRSPRTHRGLGQNPEAAWWCRHILG